MGVVGGTLKRWLKEHTPQHEIKCFDPGKGLKDDLAGCNAIFISVPVPATPYGQDVSMLDQAVTLAKKYSGLVFIRSTVLPGTNDMYGTISMPEFLTERKAYEDFCAHPIMLGGANKFEEIQTIFPKIFNKKSFHIIKNVDAEMAKLTHNCFGAMKVTYFNIIKELCEKTGANFENVKFGASMTGFIGPQHTQVPGPDGLKGYGGKCFPENMLAMSGFLKQMKMNEANLFFTEIMENNNKYRRTGFREQHQDAAL